MVAALQLSRAVKMDKLEPPLALVTDIMFGSWLRAMKSFYCINSISSIVCDELSDQASIQINRNCKVSTQPLPTLVWHWKYWVIPWWCGRCLCYFQQHTVLCNRSSKYKIALYKVSWIWDMGQITKENLWYLENYSLNECQTNWTVLWRIINLGVMV